LIESGFRIKKLKEKQKKKEELSNISKYNDFMERKNP